VVRLGEKGLVVPGEEERVVQGGEWFVEDGRVRKRLFLVYYHPTCDVPIEVLGDLVEKILLWSAW